MIMIRIPVLILFGNRLSGLIRPMYSTLLEVNVLQYKINKRSRLVWNIVSLAHVG